MSVLEKATEFKRKLAAGERAQVTAMMSRWRALERHVQGRIDALAGEIQSHRDAGTPVTESQLYQMTHYQELLAQIQGEFHQLERKMEGIISEGWSEALGLGIRGAQETIEEAYREAGIRATFNRIPVEAVEYMAGMTADGGPLFGVLEKRALMPAAVQGLTDNLVTAVAMGWGPRKTAAAMRDGLTDGLQKALVIARDTQMRAYRMATDEQYRRSGVVEEKRRLAAKDLRTCLACLYADGEFMSLEEPMYDHVQGRCTTVPLVRGVPTPDWVLGEDWIKSLPEEKQLALLGPVRIELWRTGRAGLGDFVVHTEDPVWGKSLGVKSLAALAEQGIELPKPKVLVPVPPVEPAPEEIPVHAPRRAISAPGLSADFRDSEPLTETDLQLRRDLREGLADTLREYDRGRVAELYLRADLEDFDKDIGNSNTLDRVAVKRNLISQIAKRSGLSEETTDQLVKTWAHTSGDRDVVSMALQVGVSEEFGVSPGPYAERLVDYIAEMDPFDQVLLKDRFQMEGEFTRDKLVGLCRRFSRAVYDGTQAELAALSGKNVSLYRGLGAEEFKDAVVGQEVSHMSYAASSWSLSYGTADMFAPLKPGGAVLYADIPVERIFSTFLTGPGCMGEQEIVVLGQAPDAPTADRFTIKLVAGWG